MIERIFPGDSDHAKCLRKIDWSTTSLGAPDRWSPGLSTALYICATSRTPALVLWGRELTLVYNEAAAKLLEDKDKTCALARSGREIWPELEAYDGTAERVSVEVGDGGIELVCSPLYDDDGNAAGVWAEIADRPDVTDRSQARAKDDFLALFGHEVRNPLSTIAMTAEVLARQSPSDETELLSRAVRQLSRLINDLVDLSRLHRGKIELHRTNVELAQIIDLAVARERDFLDARKTRIELQVPTGLAINCDADRIAQAIGNAIHNAAKFSEPNAAVVISAVRANGRASIHVRDQGSGVAPDRLEGLFEAFSDRRSAPAEAGLGLGLAIARHLIELHGGEARAASAGPGHGTEIVFELPLGESMTTPPKKARKRVLIVEDNHDTAVALQRALELLGYHVAIAHNGPVALTVARGFQPDVALLDINLPVMDGWELARRLRAVLLPSRPVRLVAVTARDQEQDKLRSSEVGFVEHLVKPIDLNTLERMIDSLPDPSPSP